MIDGSAPDRTEWSGRWRYICGAPPPAVRYGVHSPSKPVNIHRTYICWLTVRITQPWYSRLTLVVLSFGAYEIQPGTDRSMRELTRRREKARLITVGYLNTYLRYRGKMNTGRVYILRIFHIYAYIHM